MAARTVIPARYVVFLPPSERGVAWRTALADAATRASLAYIEDGIPPESTEGFLLVYDEPGLVDQVPANRIVIIDRADEVINSLSLAAPGIAGLAIRRAARWFWHANALVRYGGAVLVSADTTELKLNCVGRVAISPLERDAASDEFISSLAVYDSLPPKKAVKFPVSRHLFSYGVDNEPLSGSVDLTGRARLLVHGPHIMLPEGLWRITAHFNLLLDGPPVTLAFSWGCDEAMPISKKRMDRSGVYEVEMVAQIPVAADVQFRITLAVPVLQGELKFVSATVESL